MVMTRFQTHIKLVDSLILNPNEERRINSKAEQMKSPIRREKKIITRESGGELYIKINNTNFCLAKETMRHKDLN
uniref:Uncharacterized protein n=1 Tax=Oryza glumipatula TaxID=40148 RepID=A0A0E0AD01_9ORYZ